jgi:hypothetical protein
LLQGKIKAITGGAVFIGRILEDAFVINTYPQNKNFGRKLGDLTFKDFCEHSFQQHKPWFSVHWKLKEFKN